MKSAVIAIHGGAGTIPKNSLTSEQEQAYRSALDDSLSAGYAVLSSGGTALEGACAAVRSLENSPLFNAGRGSVFNVAGLHEMEAAVMEGHNMDAGAVAGLRAVKNPVDVARAVMEKSEHVMIVGAGAEQFAKEMNLPFESEEYFFDALRYEQWQDAHSAGRTQLDHSLPNDRKIGTVGAVALDTSGNIAGATSTGGMTNKRIGRVGDTPIIGAGTYANNSTAAISCTGHGEPFIRAVTAYDVSCLIEYKGMTLRDACEEVVQKKLTKIDGDGGLVAVDAQGNVELCFNSEGMYRGAIYSDGHREIAIYR